jgi:serine-type D-Ala-D-Ala carboxypeptidase/endopeptidase (penicillin-binding protein 4)
VISSRGVLLIAVVSLLSMDSDPARSQGSGSGSDTDDDDAAANGAGSGLVAPKDPKARASWLRDRFAAAVAARPILAHAKIGFAAVDLTTGAELAARDGDKGMSLASNAKLLTSIAALGALGSGFRWRTAVFAAVPPDDTGTVAGDLYLRGRGDPTLSVAGMRQLALDVAAAGVRIVEGSLIVDGAYFDAAYEPPHFDEQPKERAGFRAPIASLAVNHSAVTVTVMAEPGGAARVLLDPETDYVRLGKVEVTSVTRGRTRLRVDLRPKPESRRDAVELDVTGQIRVGEGSWDLSRRIDDPSRFAAEVFRKLLAEQGIKLRDRTIGSGVVPPTAKLVAHHDSPTLADVLRPMNKHSDNNIAEHVLKTLGAELKGTPGPATWADAQTVLAAQLAKLGLVPGSYRSDNGSGLFSSSEVSPKQLVRLLVAAHKDYRVGPDLVASLPVGGLDGTLARRWQGRPALGRVRAKTGTLDRVSTLAGYIGVDTNHVVAFAIFVNDVPPGQRGMVRAMADDMVDALAAYLGAP